MCLFLGICVLREFSYFGICVLRWLFFANRDICTYVFLYSGAHKKDYFAPSLACLLPTCSDHVFVNHCFAPSFASLMQTCSDHVLLTTVLRGLSCTPHQTNDVDGA